MCEGREREEGMLAVENRKSLMRRNGDVMTISMMMMRDDCDAWMDVCVYV